MAFTPKQQNWRWYQDNAAEPTVALASENIAPAIIAAQVINRLRLTIAETGGTAGSGAVTLEYSLDDSSFVAFDATAAWNYVNGKGTEGGTTTTYLTSDGTTHGLYHENASRSESWLANAIREMDFAIMPGPTISPLATYYFRAKIAGTIVPLNTAKTHPSVTVTVQVGLNVSKANIYGVTTPSDGLNVSKANIYSVSGPPDGLNVSKANIYAVVGQPFIPIIDNLEIKTEEENIALIYHAVMALIDDLGIQLGLDNVAPLIKYFISAIGDLEARTGLTGPLSIAYHPPGGVGFVSSMLLVFS